MPATIPPQNLGRLRNPEGALTEEEANAPVTMKMFIDFVKMQSDTETKLRMLLNHLGVDISENYDRFRLVDYKNGRNPINKYPSDGLAAEIGHAGMVKTPAQRRGFWARLLNK